VRLDPFLVDQPALSLGIAVGAIAHELLGIEAIEILNPIDHVEGGVNLGLADRRADPNARQPCPRCGGVMIVIEIFSRGQKPKSRAPPSKEAA